MFAAENPADVMLLQQALPKKVLEKTKTPDFSDHDFRSTNNLNGFSFKNANLKNACFDGMTLDNINFSGADLSGASFKNAILTRCSFAKTTLKGTHFEGAQIRASTFSEAQITKANFNQSLQTSTNYDYANVTCATYTEAKLKSVSFTQSIVKGVTLEDTSTRSISKEGTVWDEHFSCPPSSHTPS